VLGGYRPPLTIPVPSQFAPFTGVKCVSPISFYSDRTEETFLSGKQTFSEGGACLFQYFVRVRPQRIKRFTIKFVWIFPACPFFIPVTFVLKFDAISLIIIAQLK